MPSSTSALALTVTFIRWTCAARKRSPSFTVVNKRWLKRRAAQRKLNRILTLKRLWKPTSNNNNCTHASTPTSSADIEHNTPETREQPLHSPVLFAPIGHNESNNLERDREESNNSPESNNPAVSARSVTPIFYPPGTEMHADTPSTTLWLQAVDSLDVHNEREKRKSKIEETEKQEEEMEEEEEEEEEDEDIPIEGRMPGADLRAHIADSARIETEEQEEEMEVEEEEDEEMEVEEEEDEEDEDMPIVARMPDADRARIERAARSSDPRLQQAAANNNIHLLASVYTGVYR